MRADWFCIGSYCWPFAHGGAGSVEAAFNASQRFLGARAKIQRWVRYRVGLENIPESPAKLEPLTEDLLSKLRQHPDKDSIATTFHLWELGFRSALIWIEGGEPLCIQWLLTSADNPLLRRLGGWAGLYPPLPSGTAQVEGLFAFSTARRKGAATDFEFALYAHAKSLGLQEIVTHIVEGNEPAHRWAAKTGWKVLGKISRLELDLPALRHVPLVVHRTETPTPAL